MKSRGKWIEGVRDQTPLVEAARTVIDARVGSVIRLLGSAPRRGDAEDAHQLRVSCRRAAAAIAAFESWVDADAARRARRRLRRIRRATGEARDCDVHADILRAEASFAEPEQRPVIEYVLARIAAERADAQGAIRRASRRHRKPLRRLLRRLRRSTGKRDDSDAATLADAARRTLRRRLDRLRAAADADLGDSDNLHALRLRTKGLRYALEVFAPCFAPELREIVYPRLAELQDILGGVNDIHRVVERLERLAREHDGPGGDTLDALSALARRYKAVRDRRHREAIDRIASAGAMDFIAALDAMLVDANDRHAPPPLPEVAAPTASRAPAPNGQPLPRPAETASGPRRLAAIDVGTNSIRLLVAEAHPDGSYRVLDDEKEVTRLGRGLGETGLMSAAAIERSVHAVERMKRIAMGYGVHALRVVGTSACREAANRDDLVRLLRDRAGVELQVISALDEARLAYLSAAHAFDLGNVTAAVVDIGGGSTEIVLSAGGVTEQIASLPLGAVRLTEQFGGPERCAAERFRAMRRHIRRTLAETLRRPAPSPQLVIGTGGTFSTLANILSHRDHGPLGPSLWDRGVPGHEAKRADLRHVLDRLRRMPVRDRERVPGLPAERADIIVAGLAIAERVLRHLGANVVRVHDRGIRDGLVLQMAAEAFPAARTPTDDRGMRAVRRFAEQCRYEASHCEHVTRLALSIHDQLARLEPPDEPRRLEERRLLEAAGVLHDAGYLVNYSRHHKHSYHLIVHADLPGFSRREVEIIANVARYHRQAEPRRRHPNFATLDRADRALVRRLAAILRIADGLDRTHTQNTRGVTLAVDRDAARFCIAADQDPATDLWGAGRKGALFRRVFGLEPVFEWSGPAADEAGGRADQPDARRAEPAPLVGA